MMNRLRLSPKWFALLGVFVMLASCGPGKAIRMEQSKIGRDLGEAYLGEGNITSALTEFLKAEKLYSDDPYLQYDLGLAYFAKQKLQSAIIHLDKAIALKPDYSEALNAVGTVYLRLKEWDKAILHFNKARENLLYATPYLSLNNLGEAYRGKRDFESAKKFYRMALEDNPRFPNAQRGLGLVFMEMGEPGAAVTALEKAVEYDPSFTLALYDLARAYTEQFEIEKAIAAFKKVIAFAPDSSLANSARIEIKSLQK